MGLVVAEAGAGVDDAGRPAEPDEDVRAHEEPLRDDPTGPIVWYDPGAFRGRRALDDFPVDDPAVQRRFRALGWVALASSATVLAAVVVSSHGRPPALTLALAIACFVVAAYRAVVVIAAGSSARRRGRVLSTAEYLRRPEAGKDTEAAGNGESTRGAGPEAGPARPGRLPHSA